MGGKRKKTENEGTERDGVLSVNNESNKKSKKEILPSMIKNREKRSQVHAKLKQQKKLEKRNKLKGRDAQKQALELGQEPPPSMVPRTIENTRELDETVCKPDDEELFADNDADEFGSILKREHTPNILITSCRFNSSRGPAFIQDLLRVIPNAHYYKRGTYDLKQIVEYANKEEFTSIIVVHTNHREPDALLIICLPEGPTARFKLSRLVLCKDIKNHGNPTSHQPELVLANFTTCLGHRIGRFDPITFLFIWFAPSRMVQSLFPQDPDFRGRRVVTFHSQRDFILSSRYIFETKESKLIDPKVKANDGNEQYFILLYEQECGPRFTLKLISLQRGTFDTKGREFEWVHKPEMDTSGRRFFL
ncbi:LOW QUALITY PROTEIN: Brix domain-containing protein [Cephalotus follicularis]|uniref:Brix domain-containing protein n=1 Tax=Cephalotus follicularis TaxID=3775 RepID=A0A1Q3BQ06_CEPFO|nr:LOW QUALITY PROTEIN: Brix domain-containing protein [Cephalotus follicularis]